MCSICRKWLNMCLKRQLSYHCAIVKPSIKTKFNGNKSLHLILQNYVLSASKYKCLCPNANVCTCLITIIHIYLHLSIIENASKYWVLKVHRYIHTHIQTKALSEHARARRSLKSKTNYTTNYWFVCMYMHVRAMFVCIYM